jgi:methylmalonic aciduria homocystinuria type C protein
MEEAISIFKSTLETYGIDILQPLALSWYNNCLPEHALASQIPLPPSPTAEYSTTTKDDALTLVIGNSKAIWPKFLECCASDSSILNDPHPLNAYMERSINTALAQSFPPSFLSSSSPVYGIYKIYWSHTTANLRGGEGFVAMQRMAECCGLAYLDHTCHLSFHPTFGPWFSLRCAIVVFCNGVVGTAQNFSSDGVPTGILTPPIPLNCPLDKETMLNVQAAAAAAFSSERKENDNGADGAGGKLFEIKDVCAKWEKWLAVRDAAAPGHPYRYSEEQILYHYTGDRQLLRKIVSDFKRVNQSLK